MLTDVQKRALLAVARDSISHHLAGHQPVVQVLAPMPDASGVFVTITRGGELRGCLGTLELDGALASEVARWARDSATRDPRFPPVSVGELPDTRIEISVLGPLAAIDPLDPGAIEIGPHGLVVEQGPCRGLLLPQVAVEWGWTREEFLSRTCQKAGLPVDAWRYGAQVWRFDAQVFGETGNAPSALPAKTP
jgi:AmmeMemoRadiSam system protein A